jgi:hypothetical protein
MTDLLFALSRHPAGVQVTLYPNRVTIDIGYNNRSRYEGETLEQALVLAVQDIRRMGGPPSVIAALSD